MRLGKFIAMSMTIATAIPVVCGGEALTASAETQSESAGSAATVVTGSAIAATGSSITVDKRQTMISGGELPLESNGLYVYAEPYLGTYKSVIISQYREDLRSKYSDNYVVVSNDLKTPITFSVTDAYTGVDVSDNQLVTSAGKDDNGYSLFKVFASVDVPDSDYVVEFRQGEKRTYLAISVVKDQDSGYEYERIGINPDNYEYVDFAQYVGNSVSKGSTLSGEIVNSAGAHCRVVNLFDKNASANLKVSTSGDKYYITVGDSAYADFRVPYYVIFSSGLKGGCEISVNVYPGINDKGAPEFPSIYDESGKRINHANIPLKHGDSIEVNIPDLDTSNPLLTKTFTYDSDAVQDGLEVTKISDKKYRITVKDDATIDKTYCVSFVSGDAYSQIEIKVVDSKSEEGKSDPENPTKDPTENPEPENPTKDPTENPTKDPTDNPEPENPSKDPSTKPTEDPGKQTTVPGDDKGSSTETGGSAVVDPDKGSSGTGTTTPGSGSSSGSTATSGNTSSGSSSAGNISGGTSGDTVENNSGSTNGNNSKPQDNGAVNNSDTSGNVTNQQPEKTSDEVHVDTQTDKSTGIDVAQGTEINGVYQTSDGVALVNSAVDTDDGIVITDKNGEAVPANSTVKFDGKTRLINSDGVLATNEKVKVGNKTYVAKKDGSIARKAFVELENTGNRVYTNKSGNIIKNKVFKVKGKRYIARKSGALVKNGTIKIKGKKYVVKNYIVVKTIK